MDLDFVQLLGRALWALIVLFYMVAAGLSFHRGKLLLGCGFVLMFLTGGFTWIFSVFLAEWVIQTFPSESSTIFNARWILTGLVEVGAWVLVCAGLYTGLAPKED